MEVLAKSSGSTLAEHTEKVLECIRALEASGVCGGVPDAWWQALRYAGLLHDLGKLDPVFQTRLRGGGRSGRKEILPDEKKCRKCLAESPLPHSLFALFFIGAGFLPLGDDLKDAVLSAVAFHHWRENFPDYLLGALSECLKERAKMLAECRGCYEGMLMELKEGLRQLAEEHGLSLEAVGFNEDVVEYLMYNDLGASGLITPPYSMIFLSERMKATDSDEEMRIFVAGNLMRADHFASYMDQNQFVQASQIEMGEVASYEELKAALEKRFNRLWQAHLLGKMPDIRGRSVVVIAPTGVGKTEFASLWGGGRKLFFVLPLRVAANSMYERISSLLGSIRREWGKNAALLHGDAALALRRLKRLEEGEKEPPEERPLLGEDEIEGESRQAVELARHLGHPYIVCTADQIVPAALRYPGFERIYAALMGACVAIDEVQAYDPRAAAIVTHLVQQVTEIGGSVLLMTATLPGFVRTQLEKRTGVETLNLLEEVEELRPLAASSRHSVKLEKWDGDSFRLAEQLIGEARKGKKVLVVMNTVKAAREVYEGLLKKLEETKAEVEPVLLHSRFTMEHRRKKEDSVFRLMPNIGDRPPGGCVVVATQIVEASLDLDADILFTEAAPVDSLVQRMGRVYRRYALKEGRWAPGEEANVVILVQSPAEGGGNGVLLGSGVGKVTSPESRHVYDFEFTLLSLAVLAVMMEMQSEGSISAADQEVEIENRVWQLVADLKQEGQKKKKKTTARDLAGRLVERLADAGVSTLALTERQKQIWVDVTYKLLEKNPTGIGSYVRIYEETLDILDHGYCSDRRSDAQRLFRQMCDCSIVPSCLEEEFYDAVARCIAERGSRLSYDDIAEGAVSRFVVSAPWYLVKDVMREIEVGDVLSRVDGLDSDLLERRRSQLERWLSGINLADLDYDSERGLLGKENE
ncbi:MAG TPA: CRISPR-associated helicase Cas3' [Syntrophomonadaceae bacterium]|nr:CRISPR-associated helicase Cas3' [Syntrophomonadaceae bacterium]